MGKTTILALHGLTLVGLLVLAVALATWRGALWPFDLGFSALMTAGGLAILLFAWGPVWLVLLLASVAINRLWQRVALWPFGMLAMVALHAAFGPTRGLMTLDVLTITGALHLYAVPVALTLVLGSALREASRRRSRFNPTAVAEPDVGDGPISERG